MCEQQEDLEKIIGTIDRTPDAEFNGCPVFCSDLIPKGEIWFFHDIKLSKLIGIKYD